MSGYDAYGRLVEEYDYFCGGCGRMFRSVYCEAPICPRCKWRMSDAGPDRGAKYQPPDFAKQAEMMKIQSAIDALEAILGRLREACRVDAA